MMINAMFNNMYWFIGGGNRSTYLILTDHYMNVLYTRHFGYVFTHSKGKTNIEMKKLKFNSSLQDLYSKLFIYVVTPLMV